jgi:hypothetical protein
MKDPRDIFPHADRQEFYCRAFRAYCAAFAAFNGRRFAVHHWGWSYHGTVSAWDQRGRRILNATWPELHAATEKLHANLEALNAFQARCDFL